LAIRLITTCPPRCIMPKTGGLSHIPANLVVTGFRPYLWS
jgi:hypothetical protein